MGCAGGPCSSCRRRRFVRYAVAMSPKLQNRTGSVRVLLASGRDLCYPHTRRPSGGRTRRCAWTASCTECGWSEASAPLCGSSLYGPQQVCSESWFRNSFGAPRSDGISGWAVLLLPRCSLTPGPEVHQLGASTFRLSGGARLVGSRSCPRFVGSPGLLGRQLIVQPRCGLLRARQRASLARRSPLPVWGAASWAACLPMVFGPLGLRCPCVVELCGAHFTWGLQALLRFSAEPGWRCCLQCTRRASGPVGSYRGGAAWNTAGLKLRQPRCGNSFNCARQVVPQCSIRIRCCAPRSDGLSGWAGASAVPV